MRGAFRRFLPVGVANPFAAILTKTKGNAGADMIHRKPFTADELKALLAAANGDDFMGGLITAAACTGMRRGDVCGLRWSAVDLAGGMLAVKTSKTEAEVEIPIFRPLQSVLEDRKGNGKEYVFPEAARMLAENPDGLTWRFKKIVARAFEGDGRLPGCGQAGPALLPSVPAADIEAEGVTVGNKHRRFRRAGERGEAATETDQGTDHVWLLAGGPLWVATEPHRHSKQ